MNQDQVSGKVNQAVGKVQEKLGDAMDDSAQQLEGVARQVKGKAQDVYGKAYEHVYDTADALIERVERYPLTSLAIAAGIGFIVGMLCRSPR